MIQGIDWDKLSAYVGKSTDLAIQYVRDWSLMNTLYEFKILSGVI